MNNVLQYSPYGQIRPFGLAIWSTKFSRPIFIYSAVRIWLYGIDPYLFGRLIRFLVIQFSIYLVLQIWPNGPACFYIYIF